MSWKFVEKCEAVLKVFKKDDMYLVEILIGGDLVNEFKTSEWRGVEE